jgi:hypothetical protein
LVAPFFFFDLLAAPFDLLAAPFAVGFLGVACLPADFLTALADDFFTMVEKCSSSSKPGKMRNKRKRKYEVVQGRVMRMIEGYVLIGIISQRNQTGRRQSEHKTYARPGAISSKIFFFSWRGSP